MADEKFESVQDLADRVSTDTTLADTIRRDPSAALKSLAAPEPVPDTFVYRTVVVSLGLAVVLSVVGAVFLAFYEKKLPEGVIAIGSAAAGALAGLLSPSPARG